MKKASRVALILFLTYLFSFNSLFITGLSVAEAGTGIDSTDPIALPASLSGTVYGDMGAEYTDVWYSFQVVGGQEVNFDLAFPVNYDGMMVVLDNSGEIPLQYIDADPLEGTESGTVVLGAGNYYLNVSAFPMEGAANPADSYSLTVSANSVDLAHESSEPNDYKEQATALQMGVAAKGKFVTSGDTDIYQITVANKGDLVVNLDVPAADGAMILFDSQMVGNGYNDFYNGKALRYADVGLTGEPETLKYLVETPGTYYLVVQDVMGTPSNDEYTLTASLTAAKTFSDIQGHWAQQEIEPLATRGVITGKPNNTFAPQDKVTRAEFAAMLVRALELPEYQGEFGMFDDVAPTDWFFKYVEAAAEYGIVNGTNGEFRPNDQITRQEMAAMIVRSLELIGESVELTSAEQTSVLASYDDKDSVSTWAKPEMSKAIYLGIVNGSSATTLSPVADANRAEAATMVKRMMVNANLL